MQEVQDSAHFLLLEPLFPILISGTVSYLTTANFIDENQRQICTTAFAFMFVSSELTAQRIPQI